MPEPLVPSHLLPRLAQRVLACVERLSQPMSASALHEDAACVTGLETTGVEEVLAYLLKEGQLRTYTDGTGHVWYTVPPSSARKPGEYPLLCAWRDDRLVLHWQAEKYQRAALDPQVSLERAGHLAAAVVALRLSFEEERLSREVQAVLKASPNPLHCTDPLIAFHDSLQELPRSANTILKDMSGTPTFSEDVDALREEVRRAL